MVLQPKIMGGVCLTAHPAGLKLALDKQIDYIQSQKPIDMPKRVLVIGGSGGYGLATRVAAAFGAQAGTLNVSFEREPTERKPGSPGWYNNVYFDRRAQQAGLVAESMNADAFSHETRAGVIDRIQTLFGQVDLVVYSIASPLRIDPDTRQQYRSVLKPLKQTYRAKSVDFMKGTISETSIESASEEEKDATIKVMGGEDWQLWITALMEAGVLAEKAHTVAYSYIGPQVTYPVYRAGTIGAAKEHLEHTARDIQKQVSTLNGQAFVSVNKALVTRASSVIPVVPLYISLLFRVMKEKGLHEGCIEQMYRMLSEKIYGPDGLVRDSEGLVRLDDREMRQDVQDTVTLLWDSITEENLESETDIALFREEFLKLHGFGWEEVNYEADVDPRDV